MWHPYRQGGRLAISATLLVVSIVSPGIAQPTAGDPLTRFAAEAGGPGVTGRLTERLPGSYLFVPEAPDLPALPIANPERVSEPAVGPTLLLQGHS